MSADLLYDRKALVGLLRHQVRDHLEFTRKELNRIHAAQSSIFWTLMAPMRKFVRSVRGDGGAGDFPTEHIRERMDAIVVENLQTVEQLRQAIEQSAHLRQQASYILREIKESMYWEFMGPFRAIHGMVVRRSIPRVAAPKTTEKPEAVGKGVPAGSETVSAKDFHIWIYQDFLKPVTSPIITVSGWCFCKRPGHARLQMRCRIGDREYPAEHGLRTDHVGETYPDFPQAYQSGFDFYGINLNPEDEELALDASIDGEQWHEILRLPVNNQLESSIARPPANSAGDERQIAIYYSKQGNYFYREIALYFANALRFLGYQPHVLSSEKPFHAESKWHFVISPNEFYFLGHFPRELASAQNIVFLLADQPHTPWFKRSLSVSHIASHILDISHDTVPLLKAKGLNATYLPLGYLPDFPLYDAKGILPTVPDTESLGREVRMFDASGRPLAERPIDVSFVGTLTPRRDKFFADYADRFWPYRCHFRLVGPYHIPIPKDADRNIETLVTAGISRRSKIVLNVHRDDDPYFEWHRMVLFGIWQEALVLTEKSTTAPPFVAGEDYVEVALDEIPDALDYYLKDPVGREEAERIRTSAYDKFRKECRFEETLREALKAIG